MNYYERHLGDYAKDTAHLSMLEHGAYTLILDRYYSTEQGIPADQTYRVTRARSKEEKAAVEVVLQEFFILTDGFWIKNRVQAVIAKFHDSEPDREAKRENDKERQRRARDRRKVLFDQLRGHGVVPPWDAKTSDLEATLSRLKYAPVTQPVTRDNTATQTPVTSNQSPITNTNTGHAVVIEDPDEIQRVSRQGAICMVIKAEGIGAVNPQHPDLLALIDQGADVGHFAAAARLARGKGKGFAYLLGVVKGQMADAAELAGAQQYRPAPGGRPVQAESFKAADARVGRARWEEMTGRVHPDNLPDQSKTVIDITPKILEITK
jgi:uncharacterized protein YdaU (DUF1376 family)